MAIDLFEPVRSMLSRYHEVLASHTGGGFSKCWIRPDGIAETGAVLFTVDAESPVTHAECETGVCQHPGVALDFFLKACTPKARTFGDNLSACPSPQIGCREHVFPGSRRLLENLGIDLLVETIVCSAIIRIGDAALTVAKMLGYGCRRAQAGTACPYVDDRIPSSMHRAASQGRRKPVTATSITARIRPAFACRMDLWAMSCGTLVSSVICSNKPPREARADEQTRTVRPHSHRDFPVDGERRRRRDWPLLDHRRCSCQRPDRQDRRLRNLLDEIAAGAPQQEPPRTGESIAIDASKVPSVKAGKTLREAVIERFRWTRIPLPNRNRCVGG